MDIWIQCGQAEYDFVENVSGPGMLTLHLIKRGLTGKRLDKIYGSGSDVFDVSCPVGLRHTIIIKMQVFLVPTVLVCLSFFGK